ncbi:hypothetical protein CEE36_09720 [candidate division TA06 bacterium B3_TA06]|uniref:Lipoprotein n=1 Tax=candidate division TA06 bacterium B3_TA06 TaxID=2012487 RepID=A0A532UZ15_UNCT6|nr:MAG: hypothetical protein CEE36_09720 [candidate division TA06 bacterium B3_TA06]
MKKILPAVITSTLILGLGCNRIDEYTYFPYTENSEWVYDLLATYSYTDTEYPEDNEYDTLSGTMTKKVISEIEYKESKFCEVYQILDYEDTDGYRDVDTSVFFIRIEPDSVYFYLDYTDDTALLVGPSIPEVGDQWEGFNLLWYAYMKYEVVADDEKILDYRKCLKIECSMDDYWSDYELTEYWARDVGMVYTYFKGVDEYGTEKDEYILEFSIRESYN